MRTFAPGKLVLTGAYAVLEGAPAISLAVSRGASADSKRSCATPTPEVSVALGGRPAPHVDASSMFIGSRKLGLGASAAILVASIAAAAVGEDPEDAQVRERLFARAREAHARAQGGGSGVDVATSIHGGTILYTIGQAPRRIMLPDGLKVAVLACPASARTSELRAEIDRFGTRDAGRHRRCLDELSVIADDAAKAALAGNAARFVESLRRTARGLATLGAAAGVGIVPEGFETLEAIAARHGASFSVSGAGGGDVAVYIGPSAPPETFIERADALGLFSLPTSLDHEGVRTIPSTSAVTEMSDSPATS
jgi:phosphomevalonate kinase